MKKERLSLLNAVDRRAKSVADHFVMGELITEEIINTIIDLYTSAKVERDLQDEFFEAAYHAPITGELEFFIARILYHISNFKNLKWKIFLRRQESKTAPDIRIQKEGETISIIEIKAKGGWIQPFLSPERYTHDRMRKSKGETLFEPDGLIQNHRNQLTKYISTFNLNVEDVFFFLPTLALVHRKKYKSTLEDYYSYFNKTSSLPESNLILLSSNKRLDLSNPSILPLEPTNNFERMINEILDK